MKITFTKDNQRLIIQLLKYRKKMLKMLLDTLPK